MFATLDENSSEFAYRHIDALTQIGSRVSGTAQERAAEQYVKDQFERLGLETEVQNFSFTRGGSTVNSANVIAYKPGTSEKQLIVGAHYDAVSAGLGADDNASGVGVMLEAAERLKDIDTPYSIVFIGFGSEEVGLQGSRYYASQMTEDEIENTVGMINLDSLIAGDKMYVHAGEGGDPFLREFALKLAEERNLNIEIQRGLNEDYPAGTTGDWSDHAPFNGLGIPILAFEASNWEIGDQDGYTQTEEHGSIWHTSNDTLDRIEELFPGRIEERLATFSTLLVDLLKQSFE